MNEVVIVAATRTAIGSFQGALSAIPATELGATVIRRLLEETGLDGAQIDEVILGQVLTAGSGQNPARQTAIKAGLPFTVFIDRNGKVIQKKLGLIKKDDLEAAAVLLLKN